MSEAADPIVTAADSAKPAAPPHELPYGPISPNARLTYFWLTPVAQIVMYFVSVVPALIVAIVVMIPLIMSGDIPIEPGAATLPAELELPLLATLVVIQFPAWALLIVLWVKGFERRSLASVGFQGPNALRKYGIGLAAGVGVALLLAVLSPFVDPPVGVETESFSAGHLLSAEWMLIFVAVVSVFLMQGACEEIAFRGWMLSAAAARRGLMAGVLMNTAVFGLLHVHVLMSGVAVGVAAIVAISFVGLFLSLWAVSERSLAGVCGVHGAFNATLVVLGMIAFAGADPQATPGEVLLQTVRQATAQDGEATLGGTLAQLLVFAGLSGLIWLRLRRRV